MMSDGDEHGMSGQGTVRPSGQVTTRVIRGRPSRLERILRWLFPSRPLA
jgi:hypothetical protein